MARSRIARVALGGRRRSNRSWAGIISAAPTTIPAASKVLLGSFTPTVSGDITVLRTVGNISITSDQIAVDEQQLGAFGLIVVTDTALGVGITAVPGPVTDIADDGWFTYQSFGFELQVFDATGVNADFAHNLMFDSKGKRIVEDGRAVAVVCENSHATNGFEISFGIRMLSLIGSQ